MTRAIWIGPLLAVPLLFNLGGGCLPGTVPTGDLQIALVEVTSGLTAPTELVFPDDGSGRMFVAEQTGRVKTIAADGTQIGTLLDLTEQLIELNPGYDERGLLGLALHPDFASNGRVFVYYVGEAGDDLINADGGESRISEFALVDGAASIDTSTERIILRFGQPQRTHNAGKIGFGPDGHLYIATGDGGGRGDTGVGHGPEGNAQDIGSLLGKILRINVDGAEPYEVPTDNPFLDTDGARPEIFALGLRNPWKFSFDPTSTTARLLVADVGQSLREEVNLVINGGNYGWRVREGDVCFDPDNVISPPSSCADVDARGTALSDPALAYSHADGTSIVGGLICEGTGIAGLDGQYLFGDFSMSTGGADGRLFISDLFGDNPDNFSEVTISNLPNGRLGQYLYGFANDNAGGVYVLTNEIPGPSANGGKILRVAASE